MPNEILGFIFNKAVDHSTGGVQNAGRLARVSKRYNELVDNSPALWQYAECSMASGGAAILTTWTGAVAKAKGQPLVVLLRDIGATGAAPLSTVPLNHNDFQIRSLTLHLRNNLQQLAGIQWNNGLSFETLAIKADDEPETNQPHRVDWDVPNLLDHFPSTPALSIESFHRILVPPTAPWIGNLQSLKVACNQCSIVPTLLTNSPNLISLELTETTYSSVPSYTGPQFPHPITLAKLKVFKVDFAYPWLGDLTCPELTTLGIGVCIGPGAQAAHDFIQRHQKIMTFQIRRAEDYGVLFTAFHHLENLFLASNTFIMHGNPKGFVHAVSLLHNLNDLVIHDNPASITNALFMELVSTQALAANAVAVPKANQRLNTLTILTRKDDVDEEELGGTPWWESPLVPHGMVEMPFPYNEDPCGDCYRYFMKWS